MLISREYHNTGYVKLYGKKVVLFIQNSMITIHDQSLIKNKIKKTNRDGRVSYFNEIVSPLYLSLGVISVSNQYFIYSLLCYMLTISKMIEYVSQL